MPARAEGRVPHDLRRDGDLGTVAACATSTPRCVVGERSQRLRATMQGEPEALSSASGSAARCSLTSFRPRVVTVDVVLLFRDEGRDAFAIPAASAGDVEVAERDDVRFPLRANAQIHADLSFRQPPGPADHGPRGHVASCTSLTFVCC